MLDEREFELINIIGANLASNQRDLSRRLDLSLGLTNLMLRRLVSKGYIRISQLNKRKVQYILTPKGFYEKMRKSIKYTLKTINSIGLIKEKIAEVMSHLYLEGERHFFVLGKSDFAFLIDVVVQELNLADCRVVHLDALPAVPVEGVFLICKENVDEEFLKDKKAVDLIQELAKDDRLVNYKGE